MHRNLLIAKENAFTQLNPVLQLIIQWFSTSRSKYSRFRDTCFFITRDTYGRTEHRRRNASIGVSDSRSTGIEGTDLLTGNAGQKSRLPCRIYAFPSPSINRDFPLLETRKSLGTIVDIVGGKRRTQILMPALRSVSLIKLKMPRNESERESQRVDNVSYEWNLVNIIVVKSIRIPMNLQWFRLFF